MAPSVSMNINTFPPTNITESDEQLNECQLGTDGLPWTCLEYIKLNETDTTSSSRIFIKVLAQELSESLGKRLI